MTFPDGKPGKAAQKLITAETSTTYCDVSHSQTPVDAVLFVGALVITQTHHFLNHNLCIDVNSLLDSRHPITVTSNSSGYYNKKANVGASNGLYNTLLYACFIYK